MVASLSELLRAPRSLAQVDSRDPIGFEGEKADAKAQMSDLGDELADLQKRLHAQGVTGGEASVLLVLQGMDTSGKGGIIRHVAGMVDPLGLAIAVFKQPTPEELEHDFLWRVRPKLPGAGQIAVFDRSHYEDVLVARVRELADATEVDRRYGAINELEREYVDAGGTVVKCLLHISKEDQRERLQARLDDPTKRWKFAVGDLDDRERWDEYQTAYDLVLERTSTDAAPWHVVPSGRKWYRNWAVATLLLEHLRAMDLTWPTADFDVAAAAARLAAS